MAFEALWHYIFGEPPVIDPIYECELLECTDEQERKAVRLLKDWLAAVDKEEEKLAANLGMDLRNFKRLLANMKQRNATHLWTSDLPPRARIYHNLLLDEEGADPGP